MTKKKPTKKLRDNKFPLVHVSWVDSCEQCDGSGRNAEIEYDTLKTLEPQVISQVGHLIKETGEYVTIAGAWKERLRLADYVICIPKCSIKDINHLTFTRSD